jgi:hypothetical protein
MKLMQVSRAIIILEKSKIMKFEIVLTKPFLLLFYHFNNQFFSYGKCISFILFL